MLHKVGMCVQPRLRHDSRPMLGRMSDMPLSLKDIRMRTPMNGS